MRLIDADRLMGDFSCTFYNDLDDQNRTEKLINEAPTIERPHGEWIKDDWVRDLKGEFHRQYTCSECGHQVIKCYSFCVCGADMREGEAE